MKKGDRDGIMSMERYKPAEGEIGELIMVEETQMFKDYCLFNTNETTVVLTCGLLNLYQPSKTVSPSFTVKLRCSICAYYRTLFAFITITYLRKARAS